MSLFRNLVRKFQGPCCHLEAEEKGWVERRMVRFHVQFGAEPIRREPLDPRSPLLPKTWNRSYAAGEDLFKRLCDFMRVDAARLELEFYSGHESRTVDSAYAGNTHSSGPAGLYRQPEKDGKLLVSLDQSGLSDPMKLVATICHELGHVHLLADGRISPEEKDSEPLTDLLTVYFGTGIFNANAAFQFGQWQSHSHQGWRASRLGYLSEQSFGYALACYAWYRGDVDAAWRKYLRENIAYYFDDSMHFLSTTKDTIVPFDGA